MSFDFDAAVTAPFRMQPGLRRRPDGAPLLTPLAPGSRHQREKLAVLSALWTQALQVADGFDPDPALCALAAHAAGEHPEAWSWDGGRAVARHLATAVAGGQVEHLAPGRFGLGDEIARCLRGLPDGWRLPGLMALAFAEDLALLDARDGSVPWLAVLLPSHWAPAHKVGRHFTEVHAPVADNERLLAASQALVATVAGDERWERFVWTITAHPRLNAHPAQLPSPRWPPDAAAALPDGAWWRTEQQRFLPLAGTDLVAFAIDVDVQPLAEVASRPDRAHRLHEALASMSDAVVAYRGLQPVHAALLAWLRRAGAA